MSTKIVKCKCISVFQDQMYGDDNRVANEMKSGQFRCSVCGNIAGSQSVTQVIKKEPVKEIAKPVKSAPEKKIAGDKKGKKDDKPLKKVSMKGGKR